MLITKRLTRPVNHISKDLYKRRITKSEKDNTVIEKVFFYGEINFIAIVGCFELTYYYGIDFNRILN